MSRTSTGTGTENPCAVTSSEHMPDRDHYAILLSMGAGQVAYFAYNERRNWEAAVKKASRNGDLVGAMYVKLANVQTRVEVSVADYPVSSGGEAS